MINTDLKNVFLIDFFSNKTNCYDMHGLTLKGF